jgi:hypothetical protein
MARIFMEGFEHRHISTSAAAPTETGNKQTGLFTNYSTGSATAYRVSTSTVSYAQSQRSLRFFQSGSGTQNFSLYRILGSNKGEIYGRFNIRFGAIPNTREFIAIYQAAPRTTEMFKVSVSTTGVFTVFISGNSVGTFSIPDFLNNWKSFEFRVKRSTDGSTSDGLVEIRVNGETVFSADSLINARNANVLNIGSVNAATAFGDGFLFYIDDIAINDAEGTNNNSWIGDGWISMLLPTEDGSYTDFSRVPTEKDTYEILGNRPYNNSEYIRSEQSVGDKSSVKVQTVKSLLNPDFDYEASAIAVYITGRRTDGTAYVKLNKDSEESDAILLNTSTANGAEQVIFEKSSGAYTEAEIEASEYGVKNAGPN